MVVLGACSSNKNNSAKGDVRGVPLLPVSANARPSRGTLDVEISSAANTCTTVHVKSTTTLTLTFPALSVPPGTYAVVDGSLTSPGPGQVEASFREVGAACANLVDAIATGGSVVVSGPLVPEGGAPPPPDAGGAVAGSFDLVFANDHLTGTFDATICAPATALDAGPSSTVDAGRPTNTNFDAGIDCAP
jgi:hypothetical protein